MTATIYRRNDINRFRTEIHRRVRVFREINILAKHLNVAEKLIREIEKKNLGKNVRAYRALISRIARKRGMIILLLTMK